MSPKRRSYQLASSSFRRAQLRGEYGSFRLGHRRTDRQMNGRRSIDISLHLDRASETSSLHNSFELTGYRSYTILVIILFAPCVTSSNGRWLYAWLQ